VRRIDQDGRKRHDVRLDTARELARSRYAVAEIAEHHPCNDAIEFPPEEKPVYPMPRKIGYAAGAFDLFHVGHLNILKHARSQCDYLIAGVVSDEMLQLTKGITPIIPLAERLEIVSHISYVDEARAEVVPDKLETWRDVGFTIFFKGDDWRGTEKGLRLESEFSAVGVEVVYFPYTIHTSSTQLRRALDIINSRGSMTDEVHA
jgi:glycerol-3-phosphate cytidylyltransferase